MIWDIADTIKVSNVTDRQAPLTNTFLRDFRPAPGIAVLYRRWAAFRDTAELPGLLGPEAGFNGPVPLEP